MARATMSDTERLAAMMAKTRFSGELLDQMATIARGKEELPQVRATLKRFLKGWGNELNNALLVIEYMRSGGDE